MKLGIFLFSSDRLKSCLRCFCFCLSKPDMSRLRLAAGSAIVKLAQEPCYHEIITLEQYQLCALAINVRTVGILSCALGP